MFVLGDLRFDARVLREAASLAGAGYEVTIVCRPIDLASPTAEREGGPGYAIVRVPQPGRLVRRWLARPRQSRAAARGRDPLGELLSGPRGARSSAGSSPHPASALRSAIGGLAWLVRLRLGALAWAASAARLAPPADVWHGHDLPGLAAAWLAWRQHGGRLVYDAHEIYLEAGMTARRPAWARAVVRRLERGRTRDADALVTVNDALAASMATSLQPRRTVVVHNCPPRFTPEPRPAGSIGPLRSAAGIASGEPVALYHGALVPFRGVEVLAEAIREPGLESTHAVFLGFGPLADPLRRLATAGGAGSRIHLLDAVEPAVLEAWIADADVGVMALAPSTLNHRLSTPNKLFECLAAGVPVVGSDFPGIRDVVLDGPEAPVGAVCDPSSVADLGRAMRGILDLPLAEAAALRARCLKAAHERWNWEVESATLLQLYSDLGAPGGAANGTAASGTAA